MGHRKGVVLKRKISNVSFFFGFLISSRYEFLIVYDLV